MCKLKKKIKHHRQTLAQTVGRLGLPGIGVLGLTTLIETVATQGHPKIFNLILSIWGTLIILAVIFENKHFIKGFKAWHNRKRKIQKMIKDKNNKDKEKKCTYCEQVYTECYCGEKYF